MNYLFVFLLCFFFHSGDVVKGQCYHEKRLKAGNTGIITSPNFPSSYPPNTDCTYVLIGLSSKDRISIEFTDFNLETHLNCNFDYVAIYDGDSTAAPSIDKLCGTIALPRSVSASSNALTIHFHADDSQQENGFRFTYRAGCSYEFSNTSGLIESPGFPNDYFNNIDCLYNIELSQGSQILLTFDEFVVESSSECNFDSLNLYTGNTILGSYCGVKNDYKRLLNTSRLTMKFKTDKSVARTGFSIQYQATTNCDQLNGGCEQFCNSPHPGMVICSCAAGYTLQDNGISCSDINECDVYNPCSEQCSNTIGSFQCSCSIPRHILSPDNRTCTDITCKINNGGCEHVCHPFGIAQYTCACHPGYIISDDAHNCTDINECNTTNSKYSHQCVHNCINEPGSYYCTCDDGYQVSSNRRGCVDIDECPANEHLCSHFCQNVPGGWECACYPGYEVDPDDIYYCIDIDECSTGYPQTCLACHNIEGSYICDCKDGYEPNDDRTNCSDINECLENNGGCAQVCINNLGSYTCTCKAGYINQSDSCVDINECATNNLRGPCDHYCENHDGSFECHCSGGFTLLQDKLSCQDNNECDGVENGGCQQECVNTEGSFRCKCFSGHKNVNGTCIDIDECLENPCDSDVNAQCFNAIGNFSCKCPSGYIVVNVTECVDIDECQMDHSCQQECINTIGSYSCSCFEGYSLQGENDECLDINECSSPEKCDQQCYNSVGSFRCDCDQGYFLLGDDRNCSDRNECDEGLDDCNQICVNEIGYHRCECNEGFKLQPDNFTCIDIDECAANISGCSDSCLNTEGSYICFCNEGYTLKIDNRTCEDVNECSNNNGGCEHICNNAEGSFSCGCRVGFSFDGVSGCEDIDECLVFNGNCSQICLNNEGSYECQCEPNFELTEDEHNCTHCPTCHDFKQVQNDVAVLKQLSDQVEQLTLNNLRLSAKVSLLENKIDMLEERP